MRSSCIIIALAFCCSGCFYQAKRNFIPKFTNINPVSYTDVIYIGIKDTVLISTYSGRISRIINGNLKEKIIAQIDDEIYALAYYPIKKQIVAATLGNGILLLNDRNGRVKKQLPLWSTWAISIQYSSDFKYLFTNDQNGQAHIWDVENDYKELPMSSSFPKGKIVKIDHHDLATIIQEDKIIVWDLHLNALKIESKIPLDNFMDMDNQGNVLSVNFNQCTKFNLNTRHAEFSIHHPNWPLPNTENEKQIFDIPLQMEITAAKFVGNKIYTGSIDRTVRVWDKKTGEMYATLSGHKGSISKIKVSEDEKQVVSIDLKGVIKFWKVD